MVLPTTDHHHLAWVPSCYNLLELCRISSRRQVPPLADSFSFCQNEFQFLWGPLFEQSVVRLRDTKCLPLRHAGCSISVWPIDETSDLGHEPGVKEVWRVWPHCFLLHRYADELLSVKKEALSQGQDTLSWNEIQNCIDMINVQIQEENDRKYRAVSFYNEWESNVCGLCILWMSAVRVGSWGYPINSVYMHWL